LQFVSSIKLLKFAQRRIQSIIQISRQLTGSSIGEQQQQPHSNATCNEQSNDIVKTDLNDGTSSNINGSMTSDDAVVASSTLSNTDHSVTAVVDDQ
jgi:hypothetical protein